MKKLFIVRHGDYDKRIGKEQIQSFAKAIMKIKRDKSILLLSSPASHVVYSAGVIADILSINFKIIPELFDDPRDMEAPEKAKLKILEKADDAEILIVVTHKEFTKDLPRMILKEFGIIINCSTLNMGEAWLIDIEDKKMELFEDKKIELFPN